MAGWALGKTIRLGDLRRGFGLAMESEDRDLCLECAQIFEEMKQWNDAAALYERADLPDKAAMIYILETKSLSAAAKLMPRIKSPKIFVLFAKGLLSTVLLPPPPCRWPRSTLWSHGELGLPAALAEAKFLGGIPSSGMVRIGPGSEMQCRCAGERW